MNGVDKIESPSDLKLCKCFCHQNEALGVYRVFIRLFLLLPLMVQSLIPLLP